MASPKNTSNLSALKPIPSWANSALQGIVYWVGYRDSYYRHHLLSESAIVSELCNLINANMDQENRLYCEVMYQDLNCTENELKQKRADLVIKRVNTTQDAKFQENPESKNEGKEPPKEFIECVIEVKRFVPQQARYHVPSTGKQYTQISKDLERLQKFLDKQPDSLRAFCILVTHHIRPDKFITENGMARKIKEMNGVPCRVLRVWRAMHSVKKRSSVENQPQNRTHYACLIEVFRSSPKV
ncbi:MAG: hypothetical protein HQM12_19520 [SAR324 cluster bacterium]|nr:hypothetical protein [SAR324 cluster bacterium]